MKSFVLFVIVLILSLTSLIIPQSKFSIEAGTGYYSIVSSHQLSSYWKDGFGGAVKLHYQLTQPTAFFINSSVQFYSFDNSKSATVIIIPEERLETKGEQSSVFTLSPGIRLQSRGSFANLFFELSTGVYILNLGSAEWFTYPKDDDSGIPTRNGQISGSGNTTTYWFGSAAVGVAFHLVKVLDLNFSVGALSPFTDGYMTYPVSASLQYYFL